MINFCALKTGVAHCATLFPAAERRPEMDGEECPSISDVIIPKNDSPREEHPGAIIFRGDLRTQMNGLQGKIAQDVHGYRAAN